MMSGKLEISVVVSQSSTVGNLEIFHFHLALEKYPIWISVLHMEASS